jgi:competence protein ComEA
MFSLAMEIMDFRQKISKAALLLGNIRQIRGRYIYFILFFIILIAASAVVSTYFYQKSELTKKENILKSYFDQKGNPEFEVPGGIASSQTNLQEIGSSFAVESVNGETVNKNINELPSTEEIVLMKVYICGCVKAPGVYEVTQGSRIVDLTTLCGGFTQDACVEAVNLAAVLSDAEKVYIPSITEVNQQGINFLEATSSGGTTNGKDGQNTSLQGKKININSANAEELMVLPGIGEQIAKNIIDYRNQYGAFNIKEDLKNVKGIGEKKFEQIKDLISI